MATTIGPQKGETAVLEVTKEVQHRILITLSWNPKALSDEEIKQIRISGIKDVLFGDILLAKANAERIEDKLDLPGRDKDDIKFDLDLSCLAFNQAGELQVIVDPSAWNAVDESGKIYHSGDDMTGEGHFDDEQIHIELKSLPENIHEFFIIVQSDCSASFDEIVNPHTKIIDSMSNKELLHVNIEKLEDNNHYGFVFCRIFKDGKEWNVQNISEFCDFEEDWEVFLKKYR